MKKIVSMCANRQKRILPKAGWRDKQNCARCIIIHPFAGSVQFFDNVEKPHARPRNNTFLFDANVARHVEPKYIAGFTSVGAAISDKTIDKGRTAI